MDFFGLLLEVWRYFADGILEAFSLNSKFCILFEISPKLVSRAAIDITCRSELDQVM